MHAALDQIFTPEVRVLHDSLTTHAVFDRITDMASLRAFMQIHVFAVWDFMSLAKRLQRDLSCVELPWTPPNDISATRRINEIVLAEESDVDQDGVPASHLQLYLAAMHEIGADTRQFEIFLQMMRERVPVDVALGRVGAPICVIEFVTHTLKVAIGERSLVVMAHFFYGRENVIPAMFTRLLARWGIERNAAPQFVYYLDRHIELSGSHHGPAAERLISYALQREPALTAHVRQAAIASLIARQRLWNGAERILAKLPGRRIGTGLSR